MKHIHLFLAFCLIASVASAQQFQLTGQRINQLSSALLDQSLEHYALYSIDAGQIADAVEKQTQPFSLQIDLPGIAAESVQLKPNRVVADDYQLLVGTENGVRINHSRPAVSTFISPSEQDEDHAAALTFGPNFVYGLFRAEGRTMFIEPLRYFDPSQPDDLFVVYDRSDIRQGPEIACGALELEDIKEENHPEGGEIEIPLKCGPKRLQIAVANDYQMVTKYGSVANVEAHNIALINAAAVNWDNDFNTAVFLVVSGQFVPASAGADPFSPTEHNRTVLLYAMRSWAEGGGFGSIAYDYGHWRSPRKLVNDSNQQVLGATFQFQVCTDYRYSVFSDYQGYTVCHYKTIISHEMGHLFGASHITIFGSDIMAGVFAGCTDTWLQGSKDEINPYIDAAYCMQNIISSECVPPTSIPMPSVFSTLLVGQTVCYTAEDPCIGGFEIVNLNENLLKVTVEGRTICMTALEPFPHAELFVKILDHCGREQSRYSFQWVVSSAIEFTGGPEDRNTNNLTNAPLQVKSTPDFLLVDDTADAVREKDIQICDIAGRAVMTSRMNGSHIELPLAQLQPGIWVVRVKAGDEVVTRLFVR